MKRSTLARTSLWAAVTTLAAAAAAAQAPADSAIATILRERVDGGAVKGMVVGVIDPDGRRRVVAYGSSGAAGLALDGNTVFEIGSVSKTFTNTMLATMVLRGEVALDDPIQQYLPESVKVPSRNGRAITILDLATASSGLPRMPGNFKPMNARNPYADYSVQQMYDFLSSYTLPRDPGAQYEYSNLGMGLLGHLLALKAGKSYEALLTERVLNPLGMHDTRVTLTPAMAARFAHGFDAAGSPQDPWDLPTLAGAGAIRSTVNDMLKYLAAQKDTVNGPLARAIALTHHSLRPGPNATITMGLGWHLLSPHGRPIVFHNGETGGYHGFIAVDPATGANAVILANTATNIDDIGLHLVDAEVPLRKLPAPRKEVAVAPNVLAAYVGVYQLAPTFSMTVTLDGGSLSVQATGQQKFPMFAESETKFFLKVVDAQLTFERDATGMVTSMTLTQGGANQRAARVP
jgi:CubicO group peptidase (beta-lactamase class C family)